jgi:hypothetical protein
MWIEQIISKFFGVFDIVSCKHNVCKRRNSLAVQISGGGTNLGLYDSINNLMNFKSGVRFGGRLSVVTL